MNKKRVSIFVLFIFSLLFLSIVNVNAERQTIISGAKDFRIDLVSYNPSPMAPGKDAVLKFEITNLGSKDIEGLEIGFVDTYPFIVSNQYIVIDYLASGKVRQFEYIVRVQDSAPAGTYKASLQLYSGTTGKFNSETFNINVQLSSQSISVTNIKTEPEMVAPGGDFVVSVLLTNTYSTTLRDITIKLDVVNATNFAPVSTTAEDNIKFLVAGETKEIKFELVVSPNADADVYRIPISASYVDERGNSVTKSSYIGVKVNQEPVYSAYMEDVTAFEKNKVGKAVVSISNVGPVELKYLTVRILASSDYDVVSNSQIYVGNLKPDDYQTAEFEIYRKGPGPLKVILVYKDSYGNEYSKIEDIPMNYFSSSEAKKYGLVAASSGLTTLIEIIIVLLLIWLLWEWYQHKNLKAAINYVFLGLIAGTIDFVKFFKPKNLKKRYREVKEHIKRKEQK